MRKRSIGRTKGIVIVSLFKKIQDIVDGRSTTSNNEWEPRFLE
jgi:hypothetical protein